MSSYSGSRVKALANNYDHNPPKPVASITENDKPTRRRKSNSYYNVEDMSEERQLELAMRQSLREYNDLQKRNKSEVSSSSSVSLTKSRPKKILSRKSTKFLAPDDPLTSALRFSNSEVVSESSEEVITIEISDDKSSNKRTREFLDKGEVSAAQFDDDNLDIKFETTSSSESNVNSGSIEDDLHILHYSESNKSKNAQKLVRSSSSSSKGPVNLITIPKLSANCRFEGVYTHKNRFRAFIEIEGTIKHVPGLFDSSVEAAAARDEFLRSLKIEAPHRNFSFPPSFGSELETAIECKLYGNGVYKNSGSPALNSISNKDNSLNDSIRCEKDRSNWWWENHIANSNKSLGQTNRNMKKK